MITATKTSAMKNNIVSQKDLDVVYVGSNPKMPYLLASLEGFQVNVMYFENFIKAFNEIKRTKSHIDAIFCDIEIQSINALEFFKMLKDTENLLTPFILVTPTELPDSLIKQAQQLKIDDVITYPFNTTHLSKKLKWLVDSRNKRVEENKTNATTSKKHKIGFFKRAFDITLSTLALIMLSPVLLIVALLIKLDSKGPIFFISKRVGTGYKIFDFYKFRSMKTGADNMIDSMKNLNQYATEKNVVKENECEECSKQGRPCSPVLVIDGKTICENFYYLQKKNGTSSFMKFKDDPRVTKLGQFLRKSSIDELPQLINILKGDMSFVGNRPLPLYEAEQLTTDEYAKRFMAPAGLTGLWQVTKRGKSDMSEEERKQLDNTYAEEHTFIGDISLILKTIPALTQKENV